jgi:hypothetical protein
MKAAEKLVDGHDVELWDTARLIARFTQANGAGIGHLESAPLFANDCVVIKVEKRAGLRGSSLGKTRRPEGVAFEYTVLENCT